MEYTDIPQESSVNEIKKIERFDEELGKMGGIILNELWPQRGSLEFRNVWMKYRINTPVILKGISFFVKEAERIGVCGRTGSGLLMPLCLSVINSR